MALSKRGRCEYHRQRAGNREANVLCEINFHSCNLQGFSDNRKIDKTIPEVFDAEECWLV